MEEEEVHHVHFQEKDLDRHVNDVTVKQSNGKIDVHLGFLQVFHKYEITVDVPLSYLPKSETFVPIVPEIPQPFGRIIGVELYSTEEKLTIQFEVTPQREKLHKVPFSVNSDETVCQIILHARVLGKGKGTPLLKNGVKMIESLPDPDESDVNSDWQGF